jgi:phage shock protein E
MEAVNVEQAREEIACGYAIAIDVRSVEEFGEGHVPGAIHFPDGEPDGATNRPEQGARLMVIAKDGKLAARAAADLADQGYDAVTVDGDMKEWISEDFQIQPTPDPDEDTELGMS